MQNEIAPNSHEPRTALHQDRLNPSSSEEMFASFAHDIEAVRSEFAEKVGDKDARYIRKLIRIHRFLDWGGRLSMVLGFLHPLFWVVGVLSLATAKILDNMEIGHNIMHGQYDWMNDPNINSRTFEWDNMADANSWKRYHNHEHHTYTNIIGKDRDFGYGLLRMSDDTRWKRKNIWQFFTYLNLSFWFEWGVAYHELAGERIFVGKRKKASKLHITREQLKRAFFSKAGKQLFKDYLFFPLISGPMFLAVLLGNFIANILRNIWTSTIIFCGHFTEDVYTFKMSECENESRGRWFYRQILGSSNLEGSRWFYILTGHLSHQIEHHLFPDIPAHHYVAMAPKIRAICDRYHVPYNSDSFWKQYTGVLMRIIRYSFPTTRKTNSLAKLSQ